PFLVAEEGIDRRLRAAGAFDHGVDAGAGVAALEEDRTGRLQERLPLGGRRPALPRARRRRVAQHRRCRCRSSHFCNVPYCLLDYQMGMTTGSTRGSPPHDSLDNLAIAQITIPIRRFYPEFCHTAMQNLRDWHASYRLTAS